MSALDTLARLRRFNEEVRDRDPHLAEESLETARLEVSEVAASGAPPQDETELESIVMRKQRPVLAIRDNEAVLISSLSAQRSGMRGSMPRRRFCTTRLAPSGASISPDSIGRSDRHWLDQRSSWSPTGMCERIRDARLGGFAFSDGDDRAIGASVDFLQEIGSEKQARLRTGPTAVHPGQRRDPTWPFSKSRSGRATSRSPSPSSSRGSGEDDEERRDHRLSGLRQPIPDALSWSGSTEALQREGATGVVTRFAIGLLLLNARRSRFTGSS